ncbi:hypothetical protein SH661x_001951 [Planctomicrobium sp. SH661]|uniref:hypothetical protein n=1 Tax=Planctomicrobium sp. SH661 TaxID=3448124 RepID=UPI003F5B8E7D
MACDPDGEVPDLICEECGLRYVVIYSYDAGGGAADFCPRCGTEIELETPDP